MSRYDMPNSQLSPPFQHFIVLSGEAGAGKDSTADLLVERFGYRKVSMSEEMKRFAMRLFGWSHEQLFGASHLRNAPDPKWARPCANCKATGFLVDLRTGDHRDCPDCVRGKINDNSPRRVLQLLGDEWGRQLIHPDIWTMALRPSLENMLQRGVRIVVNDARFDNDRTNLRDWLGAKLVDVRSVNAKDDGAAWRKHASELARPRDEELDYIVQNDESWPFPSLAGHVERMLAELYGEK